MELRKKQEWDCRMCCVMGISLGFVLVFHSVFVSCLLQKWEELDLEAGRSWVNSSTSQKLLFIQRTAPEESRNGMNGILTQPWLCFGAEEDLQG